MDQGLALRSQDPAVYPKAELRLQLLVELEPAYRVFFRNLADLVSPPTEPPLLLAPVLFPRPLYSYRSARDRSTGVYGLAPGRRALAPDSLELVFNVGAPTIPIAGSQDSLKPRATHLLFAYRIIPGARRHAESRTAPRPHCNAASAYHPLDRGEPSARHDPAHRQDQRSCTKWDHVLETGLFRSAALGNGATRDEPVLLANICIASGVCNRPSAAGWGRSPWTWDHCTNYSRRARACASGFCPRAGESGH